MEIERTGSDIERLVSEIITPVAELPFQLCTKLGKGGSGIVFSLAPLGVHVSDDERDSSDSGDTDDSNSDGVEEDSGEEEEEECHSSDDDKDKSCENMGEEGRVRDRSKRSRIENENGDNNKENKIEKKDVDDHMAEAEEEYNASRLHIESPMGKVQLIVKMFKNLSDLGVSAICDSNNDGAIIKVLVDKRAAKHWRRKRKLNATRFIIRDIETSITATKVRTIEFVNESLVHGLATTMVRRGLTPHIAQASNAYQKGDRGYLLMERLTASLDDLFNDPDYEDDCGVTLEPEDIAGLYFQTLFAILVYQQSMQLKHHDLHTGNVFVKKIDTHTRFRGQPLDAATHFHYCLNRVDFYVPNCGLLIKIADFGLASLTYEGHTFERIDLDVFNDDPQEWGHWNSSLEGQRGYDMQVLLAETPFDRNSRFRSNNQLRRFMLHMKKTVSGKHGRISSSEKRPVPGHVSDKPPDAVISDVFGLNPEEWYDFRSAPEAVADVLPCVVTLGDTAWLPPSAAVTSNAVVVPVSTATATI